jgi:hypothetical protein
VVGDEDRKPLGRFGAGLVAIAATAGLGWLIQGALGVMSRRRASVMLYERWVVFKKVGIDANNLL